MTRRLSLFRAELSGTALALRARGPSTQEMRLLALLATAAAQRESGSAEFVAEFLGSKRSYGCQILVVKVRCISKFKRALGAFQCLYGCSGQEPARTAASPGSRPGSVRPCPRASRRLPRRSRRPASRTATPATQLDTSEANEQNSPYSRGHTNKLQAAPPFH